LLRYLCRPTADQFDDLLFEEYYSFYVVEKSRRVSAAGACFVDDRDREGLSTKYVYRRAKGALHVARMEQPSLRDNIELRALTAVLRMKPGRTFAQLRSHEGVVYGTFLECAEAMGIDLGDDQHRQILREAINPDVAAWRAYDAGEVEEPPMMTNPGSCHALRRLLVSLMIAAGSDSGDGPALAEEFFEYLTMDLPHTGAWDNDALPAGEDPNLADYKWQLLVEELAKLMFAEREDLTDYGFDNVAEASDADLKRDEVGKHSSRRHTSTAHRRRIPDSANATALAV